MKDDCVVVLNKYEEYWTEISSRRALRKVMNDRAVVLEEDRTNLLGIERVGWGDKATYKPIYKPLIIKLSYFTYYYYKSDKVQYSDNGVILRDNSVCQYWHDYILERDENGKFIRVPAKRHKYTCRPSEITIDHVQPVSRNGATNDYNNAVCACRYCNEIIKRDQTPEEAGLELIRTPHEPRRIKGDRARSIFVYNDNKQAHKAYTEYLKRTGL
jgi:hypothetical protein